ncbi:MAG: biotin/lipoyl-binding protein [Butyrivibrio sp.]|uniref:acetyl-CoA carboxylase biotin carboxyl carrier protein n=1 Tax=Butyrivibrio sp. TaxID=28121 RepID=UPI0025BBDD29|nr:acetyl-CoA carboxylase biotin carboxyl carrier protein subunit [Butyrivibrio sp.]MBQ6588055.1 biotin/lipoyl-binding protein [Butyrivibrio sp.]
MTNTLKDYVDVFRDLGLTELSVEDEGIKLVLKKNIVAVAEPASVNVTVPKADVPKENKANGTEVKAPLLGVFYSEVNGKALKVGDMVKKGDVLCSIEAMKMMNEVKAPVDGKVTNINAKEGDLVEFGQVLFAIGEKSDE